MVTRKNGLSYVNIQQISLYLIQSLKISSNNHIQAELYAVEMDRKSRYWSIAFRYYIILLILYM